MVHQKAVHMACKEHLRISVLEVLEEQTPGRNLLPIPVEWATYTERSSVCFVRSWCVKAIHKSTVGKRGLQHTHTTASVAELQGKCLQINEQLQQLLMVVISHWVTASQLHSLHLLQQRSPGKAVGTSSNTSCRIMEFHTKIP